jgi:hypothetical protein
MSGDQVYDLFVERISNVSHANGIFRITLGVNDSPDEVRPVTRLMVPANQLGPILQGIANAAKNIGEQIQPRVNVDLKGQDVDTVSENGDKSTAPKKKSSESSKSKNK